MNGGRRDGRAVVTFDAPHGAESVVLSDDEVAWFGRDASCAVRFAHAPIVDSGVPRRAGRFIVAAGRVVVECGDGEAQRSIEIRVDGAPPVMLGRGAAFSPPSREFRVAVHGERAAWYLDVCTRPTEVEVPPPVDDMPTRRFDLVLTPRQREVLAAYAEPLLRGRSEPSTHREVAVSLGCHPNSARTALYEIWARLFAAGVPMPDMSDKRVVVTEAVLLHRLLGDDHVRG